VVGEPITNLPRLVEDKCRGCGECIPACPGLAIFLVNRTYSSEEAAVWVPYEYLPLPEVGDAVDALNRRGEWVCEGRVIRVANPERNDSTVVVTLAIPKNYSDQVRSFQVTARC
jgi:Fe-S-cluster-containing hydrogenase component 2